MQRRGFLTSLAATLISAAERLPANRSVKWAVSAGLWSHYPASPITDIFDVMRDTGFIGVRLTGFPAILKTYNLTTAQLAGEVSKRNLNIVTISFGGPLNDPAQHAKIVENAKEAMRFLQNFRAKLVHKKDSSEAKFFESIYDLGDGEIDFPACHRILKQIGYKSWICVDLDLTRNGPRASYEHCGQYVVERLEPIYA